MDLDRGNGSLFLLPGRSCETYTYSATILRDKLDAGISKSGGYTCQIVRDGHMRAPFKIGNRLTRHVCGFGELGLTPSQHSSGAAALFNGQHREFRYKQIVILPSFCRNAHILLSSLIGVGTPNQRDRNPAFWSLDHG